VRRELASGAPEASPAGVERKGQSDTLRSEPEVRRELASGAPETVTSHDAGTV